MELLHSVFNLIASFLTEVAYDKSLVNNLFNFNIDKKAILIKNKFRRNMKIKLDDIKDSFSKVNDKQINENERLKRKSNEISLNLNSNKNPDSETEIKKKNNIKKREDPKKQSKDNLIKKNDSYSLEEEEQKHESRRPIMKKGSELKDLKEEKIEIYNKRANPNNETIIKKIKMNVCCYCFLSRKKNMDVNLLDEGMKVISEKLDIMNIFVKLYIDEKVQEKLLSNLEGIRMSDECIHNINILNREKVIDSINESNNG